jgi:hypothetical protein
MGAHTDRWGARTPRGGAHASEGGKGAHAYDGRERLGVGAHA